MELEIGYKNHSSTIEKRVYTRQLLKQVNTISRYATNSNSAAVLVTSRKLIFRTIMTAVKTKESGKLS